MNNSVKNPKTEVPIALSKGKINAVIMPMAIPIKYFIQTFMSKHYNILWNAIP